MGGRCSFWGVAVVAMMLTTILCSSHCCRGSVLTKANATYGEVTAELLIQSDITRYLMFNEAEVKTGNTPNPNVKACDNGAGNPMGACGGSANNKKHCNAYDGAAACK